MSTQKCLRISECVPFKAFSLLRLARRCTYLSIPILLVSCSLYDRKESVFMTDQDFVENYREFSPDRSMLLVNYSIDLGAFGYGQVGTAVLKTADTSRDLRTFSLPNTLIHTKWIDNKTISAKVDIIPSIRAGGSIKIRDRKINDIVVKVSPLDFIESDYQIQLNTGRSPPTGNMN